MVDKAERPWPAFISQLVVQSRCEYAAVGVEWWNTVFAPALKQGGVNDADIGATQLSQISRKACGGVMAQEHFVSILEERSNTSGGFMETTRPFVKDFASERAREQRDHTRGQASGRAKERQPSEP
jgi:hypothetical protein